ncbi:monooxygenase [Siccirubricoccus deserti]|uniref:LLM class flavin-dependent oxidoreductase n=1 Tax=Siccirubricoccus deserti TaxID=2013562 RepID=A0A9X0R3X1_9PROT|nr:LLM class flavin-dependent oxidoreductase [Siccirubricoccus deserti]MBC4018979.1 LLM class flavin-dependent oxidoreductase [Siccirubricoccus deserti]GGC70965.1 monooxygenase [Siccirubricoccus deserti]
MTKQMRLNAFSMNCVGHQSPGLWRHPRDRSADYTSLSYWTELARTLERGKFDGIFLADVMGVYDVYGGTPDAALRNGVQVPVNDPMLLVPGMAAVTEHLGFGITGTLSFEPPFSFARRMSTLDHLTGGRVSWNIVTGYLDSAAKAMGRQRQIGHDARYDMAEEYMEVVYKLWEGSWEDDAVRRDRAAGIFTDPAKVHRVTHHGEYYDLEGIHLPEPSPQRTPVLFQAGSSAKGQAFAASHSECVFVSAPSRQIVGPAVSKLRQQVEAAGRNSSDVLVFAMMTVIVGETDEAAQRKLEDYKAYVSHEGALVLMSGWTGIDFSGCRPDEVVKHMRNDAIHSAIDRFTIADPQRAWTVGEVADFIGIGGASPIIVGSPGRVADELEAWMRETGVDGFNLTYQVMPETFVDFVDLVVPELQKRGVFKRDYAPGTLREKLFGAGPRLTSPHPAARYRRGAGRPQQKAAE